MHARKPFVDTFAEAPSYGAYDEFPALPANADPQVHVSRNDVPQPFYLICSKDSMLVQMTGKAKVHLKHPEVLSFSMTAGDFVYVPAGTPHRIVPEVTGLLHRYKARDAGLEGVAWYCENCGNELWRNVWDTSVELPQRAYLRATRSFNEALNLRTCSCGHVHPQVDMSGVRWESIAAALESTAK